MPELNGALSPLGTMILQRLDEHAKQAGSMGADIAVIKTKVEGLERGQEETNDRLSDLEKIAGRAVTVDTKMLAKYAAIVAAIAFAASNNVPIDVWKVILSLFGVGGS